MQIDYSAHFATPDDVATHLMLPFTLQMKAEAELLVKSGGAEMACDIRKKGNVSAPAHLKRAVA